MKVAIIGGGASGIQAAKTCRHPSLNLEPTIFERTGDIGGKWRFNPKTDEVSVYDSIVIDTHRDLNSFGDLPLKPTDPAILHNSHIYKYLKDSWKEFDLEKSTRLNTEVTWLTPIDPPAGSGKKAKYRILSETKNPDGSKTKRDEVYDAVLIASGRHNQVWEPPFLGKEKFKGQMFHSGYYKDPETHGLHGKVVAVIGSGNSGVDISTELGPVAKKVHITTRRGVWCVDSKGLEGYRSYFKDMHRFGATMGFAAGWEALNDVLEGDFPPENKEILKKHNLFPDHKLLSGHPSVTGVKGLDKSLYRELEKGHVVAHRPGIKRITENGIIFGDCEEETPVDTIIFATGYRYSASFVDPKIIDLSYNSFERGNSTVPLYNFMYPMDATEQRYTNCGFVGYAQGAFAMFDLQCMHFCMHITGNLDLPSNEEMQRITKERQDYIGSRYYESPRHGTQYALDLYFYDDLAKEIGCHPWPDVILKERPEAMWAAWYCGFHASQYRLIGPFRDEHAEEWVRSCNETWTLESAPDNYADGQFWFDKIKAEQNIDLCADSPIRQGSTPRARL